MNASDLIEKMRAMIVEYDNARGFDSSVAKVDYAKKIVSMVGLSLGEHEEVRASNYSRQRVEFVFCPDGLWRNLSGVYFPISTGAFGADSIIVEGVDIQKKIVARMAAPVMCVAGTGLGFAPNALSVTPDVMRDATGPKQALVSNEFLDLHASAPMDAEERAMYEPFRGGSLAADMERAYRENDMMRKRLEAHRQASADYLKRLMASEGKAREVFEMDKADALRTEYARQRAENARLRNELPSSSGGIYTLKDAQDALPPPDERVPDETTPLYCDGCERISLPRRNQLVSMGHSVSQLIELPNEQGYALPCKNCREP